MTESISTITMLTRREIEAGIAGPLIKAFAREFGEEAALEIAGNVIRELAMEGGRQLAKTMGGNGITHFARALPLWSKGGAQEHEILEQSETILKIKVTTCRYVDMYRELGLLELGHVLSCNRDFALAEGFNPNMKLIRTQTIMQGDSYCDFHYEIIK